MNRPLHFHCMRCAAEWSPVHLPMSLEFVVRVAARAQCPNCGAPPAAIVTAEHTRIIPDGMGGLQLVHDDEPVSEVA